MLAGVVSLASGACGGGAGAAPSAPSRTAATHAPSLVPARPAAPPIDVLLRDPTAGRFTVHDLGSEVWVVDDGRIGGIRRGAVEWDIVPTKGLPAPEVPLRPRPFGRAPDAVLLLVDAADEHGMPFHQLYSLDEGLGAWTRKGFAGHFRSTVAFQPVSRDTWVGASRGLGIGENVPIEIALTDGDSVMPAFQLPCRSMGSEIIASRSGEGHFYVVCRSLDAERLSLLRFDPGSTEPTTIVDDLEDGPFVAGLLVSSKRLLFVRAEQGGATLWQVELEAEAAAAVMIERLPAGVTELVAERDGYLWFDGDHEIRRRDLDGAWMRWSLPTGAELAFPSADGGAWFGGSVVGFVEPNGQANPQSSLQPSAFSSQPEQRAGSGRSQAELEGGLADRRDRAHVAPHLS